MLELVIENIRISIHHQNAYQTENERCMKSLAYDAITKKIMPVPENICGKAFRLKFLELSKIFYFYDFFIAFLVAFTLKKFFSSMRKACLKIQGFMYDKFYQKFCFPL